MNSVIRAGEVSIEVIVRAWLTCLPRSGVAEVAQLAGAGEGVVRRLLGGTRDDRPPAADRPAGTM